MGRFPRMALYAVAGLVPGLSMIALTGPVSGEAELTLGAGGMFVAVAGFFAGAVLGAARSNRAS